MSTIGSGGGVRPGGQTSQTQKDASSDAVADVKKAVEKKVGEKLDTTRTVSDKFQVKAEASLVLSPADLAKAQSTFDKEFSPVVVAVLEQHLGVKMDPVKALKVSAQIQADPQAKAALGKFKNAIEETNKEFLATWKPPQAPKPGQVPAVPPKDAQLDKAHGADQNGTAQLNAHATTKGKLDATLKGADANKKLSENGKPGPQDKAGDKKPLTPGQKNQLELKKEATAEAKKLALDDLKKLDKTLLDAQKNVKPGDLKDAPKTDPAKLPQQDELGAGLTVQPTDDTPPPTDPPDPVPPPQVTETGGADTPGGGGGGGGGSPMPTPTPPHWPPPGGQLSGPQTKAAMSFKELASRLDDADAAECALIVLMDATRSVDQDLKAQQNLLNMRHKVNDAMRNYFNNFQLKARNIHGDQSLEWQNMSFDIGYDEAGNMTVTSFPDMTWATGTYDHVEGKGSHDITPTEGFQNNTGANGMQEAQGNGSLHQVDDKTCVGLTSWRQLKTQSVPAEADFIRSQISSMKQDNDVISQELQKLMDLRKNIIEQFGKIYQSRSDTWDQEIARLAQ